MQTKAIAKNFICDFQKYIHPDTIEEKYDLNKILALNMLYMNKTETIVEISIPANPMYLTSVKLRIKFRKAAADGINRVFHQMPVAS